MPEVIEKLRPDRDLQCYFERPSAIAALFDAAADRFKVSGTWRQQFDWCVVEWNRDNVFEHPAFRNLPNGDFTGYTLSYEETREGCILMDSDLFPTVDWPYLRVWTKEPSGEGFYQVPLREYATPIEGSWVAPAAELELQGSITAGDYVGVSFLNEHHTYQVTAADTIESAVQAIVNSVNSISVRLTATRTGAKIRVEYIDAGPGVLHPETGVNGNRHGIYGFVSGAGTESWSPFWAYFTGGQSPTKWRVTLPFGTMKHKDGVTVVPVNHIRKLRWTWEADLQPSAYARTEFLVQVSNWTVTAPNRVYKIAGPGSRRIEDNDKAVAYSGTWHTGQGNFSDGTIRYTIVPAASLSISYTCPLPHTLYLGTRYTFNAAQVTTQVDSGTPRTDNLYIAGEDTLARLPLGSFAAGNHTVTAAHAGAADSYLYFDFLEIAMEATELPSFPVDNKITLATDWDTDHSIALAPERTAWIMNLLGYRGRANHYVGALWFYELVAQDFTYATATISFAGTPAFGPTTTVTIANVAAPADVTTITHLHRIGDTTVTLAKAFELHLNRGFNAVRAVASGSTLTVYARAIGEPGEDVLITASTNQSGGAYTVTASSPNLVGGDNGKWRTDLACVPRVNRACRDWSRAYYKALDGYGIDVAAAFSLELQHGDPSSAAGIAQRYPSGEPVELNTPALQTNFSPTSANFWKQVYLDMAKEMTDAGVQPFLQFGEVQWWYFPYDPSGMTFYDQYTKDTFQSLYGHPMGIILDQNADPSLFPEEVAFLPTLIGAFTDTVMSFVRATYSGTRFEVLYPTDVNDTPLNRLINYPAANWTPAVLANLKTESFTFTYGRNLDKARYTVEYGESRGFPASQRSFLVGISDPTTQWRKEVEFALAGNIESIVLFALDQYCLVGYATPLPAGLRRAAWQG